jgi:molybdenum cofactor cytidylyltransferase
MRLSSAIGIRRGDVVAFVGGGGKTTAMFGLAAELVAEGWRVLTTTTTMIAPPGPEARTCLLISPELHEAHPQLELALQKCNHVTLAAQHLPEQNKLRGVPPEWIPSLGSLVDVVLVEADGARMKPFKAPAAHEPVMPVGASLLIPVAGIDVVGKPLSSETAHRPERISSITGLPLGAEITPQVVAQVLTHPDGGLKGFTGDRVVPLVNKASSTEQLTIAREIARLIMSSSAADRVLIGSAAQGQIAECWRRVAVVVLAAGGSTRMGTPKQLMTVSGETMLARSLRTALSLPVHEVIAVVGANSSQILPLVPPSCKVAINSRWQEGLSSSLRVGLDNISARSEAAVFLLVDQPLIGTDTLLQILYAYFGTEKGIVVPEYGGRRGTPVLFDRILFQRLQQLQGDSGGRQVIQQMPEEVLSVEVQSSDVLIDIDTMQDYQSLIASH